MSFYTNYDRYGNSVLYRGYNHQGKPVMTRYKLEPELYVPTKERTDWRALDGTPVAPIEFTSAREMRDFMEKYEGVENFKYYGQDRVLWQFIQKKFPNEIADGVSQ